MIGVSRIEVFSGEDINGEVFFGGKDATLVSLVADDLATAKSILH